MSWIFFEFKASFFFIVSVYLFVKDFSDGVHQFKGEVLEIRIGDILS